MEFQPPALEDRRPVDGQLGFTSEEAISDRAVKTDIRPVEWDTPAVEDRREVVAALGRPSEVSFDN